MRRLSASEPAGVIAFAERVLELLDESRYTTSYKYAVLLALIDLCLEGSQQSGAARHVARWAQRFVTDSSQRRQIDTLADETAWQRDRVRSLGVARGIYWRAEYDFSHAVRGVTAPRYAQGANIVVVDPKVLDVFPDGASVNEALRALAPVIRRGRRTARRRRSA